MIPSSLVCNVFPAPFAYFYLASTEMDILCAAKTLITRGSFIFAEVFLPQSHASQWLTKSTCRVTRRSGLLNNKKNDCSLLFIIIL